MVARLGRPRPAARLLARSRRSRHGPRAHHDLPPGSARAHRRCARPDRGCHDRECRRGPAGAARRGRLVRPPAGDRAGSPAAVHGRRHRPRRRRPGRRRAGEQQLLSRARAGCRGRLHRPQLPDDRASGTCCRGRRRRAPAGGHQRPGARDDGGCRRRGRGWRPADRAGARGRVRDRRRGAGAHGRADASADPAAAPRGAHGPARDAKRTCVTRRGAAPPGRA